MRPCTRQSKVHTTARHVDNMCCARAPAFALRLRWIGCADFHNAPGLSAGGNDALCKRCTYSNGIPSTPRPLYCSCGFALIYICFCSASRGECFDCGCKLGCKHNSATMRPPPARKRPLRRSHPPCVQPSAESDAVRTWLKSCLRSPPLCKHSSQGVCRPKWCCIRHRLRRAARAQTVRCVLRRWHAGWHPGRQLGHGEVCPHLGLFSQSNII